MSTDTKPQHKTRDWIAAAKAEGQANTDRHRARWKKNWDSRFDGCKACMKKDKKTKGRTICDRHLAEFKDALPCEGCGTPVVILWKKDPEYDPEKHGWLHNLCPKCEEEHPADFLEYEKARVICEGEIKTKVAMINYHKEMACDTQRRLTTQQQVTAALTKRFHDLKAKVEAIEVMAEEQEQPGEDEQPKPNPALWRGE